MKVNANSDRARYVDVYFNGKKMADCIYADDLKGVVWVMYRGADGKLVAECDAEPGSFFYEGAQVIRLRGKVEIKVEPLKGESQDDARAAAEITSAPLKIYSHAE